MWPRPGRPGRAEENPIRQPAPPLAGGSRLIDITGLEKRYGPVAALDGVDLRVPPGGVTALLGPNGAGKTTLLRCAATLERPTRGRVRVAGHDAQRHGAAVRASVGYVGHRSHLYGDLTAWENLRFYGGLYGLGGHDLDARARGLLAAAGLAERAGDRVAHLSRGQRQRLGLAKALLHDPAAVLLDEPFTGLDAAAAAHLEDAIRDLAARDRAVLLATHHVDRAVGVAHRVAVLRGGRVAHAEAVAGDRAALLERLRGAAGAPP